MAGLFGISVSSNANSSFFTENLYVGTSYVRHLGEEHCGLSGTDGHRMVSETKPGFFISSFRDQMQRFKGSEGMGYCGSYREPFWAKKSRLGSFSLCFMGNIFNFKELIYELDQSGHLFERGDNAELIAKIIAQGKSIVEGIKLVNEKIKGAYSFLLLSKKDGLYAVRCSSGQWPLILGKHRTQMSVVVSSGSAGFDNMGFDVTRELNPGEICYLKDGSISSIEHGNLLKARKCSFWPVYTSNPAALVNGLPASLARKKLGASLARRDIANGFIPHIVIPVNDSGRFHGIGYHQEYCRQFMFGSISSIPFYDEPLIKYGSRRSFLGETKPERNRRAHFKIVISAETIEHFLDMLEEAGLQEILNDILSNGRIIIVICDDSVVRGNQIGDHLAPKIKKIFERKVRGVNIKAEIHIRVSYPELLSYCPYGKTTKKGETLAESIPELSDRAKKLGVQSLMHNNLNDLFAVLGPKEDFCYDCALQSK